MGKLFVPVVVLMATVALNEKVLLPLSTNACAFEPPIADRSPETFKFVLLGFVPGETLTVSTAASPALTLEGEAVPVPVGLVADRLPCGVIEKSSIARPSSAPDASRSVQRMKKVAPLAMLRLEMVALTVVRLAAVFPLR